MSFFEFFFKYKPIVYEKGKLAFQLLGSAWWFIPVAIIACAGAFYFYKNVSREKWSPALVALRAITFLILGFMLLRPVLNISTVLPQESYLAVVIDNSESMNIRDSGDKTRAEELQAQLQTTDFIKKLSDKFKVRIYRFDKDAERIERPDRLTWNGKRTRYGVRHRSPAAGVGNGSALRSRPPPRRSGQRLAAIYGFSGAAGIEAHSVLHRRGGLGSNPPRR